MYGCDKVVCDKDVYVCVREKLHVREMCVKDCVCVCDKVVGDKVACERDVCEQVVCERVVFDKVACDKVTCEREM